MKIRTGIYYTSRLWQPHLGFMQCFSISILQRTHSAEQWVGDIVTDPRICAKLLRSPTFFAQAMSRRFMALFSRPAVTIASCIFSHTRGTPKKHVGRTSANVVFSEPCHQHRPIITFVYIQYGSLYYCSIRCAYIRNELLSGRGVYSARRVRDK